MKGRPELPQHKRRTIVQSVRFTPPEWQELETKAKQAGRLPGVFIREKALGLKGKLATRKAKVSTVSVPAVTV